MHIKTSKLKFMLTLIAFCFANGIILSAHYLNQSVIENVFRFDSKF